MARWEIRAKLWIPERLEIYHRTQPRTGVPKQRTAVQWIVHRTTQYPVDQQEFTR